MKNDTLFKLNRLVLVNSGGQPVNTQGFVDDATVDYQHGAEGEIPAGAADAGRARATLFVFVAVSAACLTAALATGSYAVWLSRRQAAHQALTDVNDILKSCQMRMQQLEAQVQRLPFREA